MQQTRLTDTTKRYGTAGTLSNKIQFYRTEADGSWTLDEDVTLTAIVRGVSQEESATTNTDTTTTTNESEVQA